MGKLKDSFKETLSACFLQRNNAGLTTILNEVSMYLSYKDYLMINVIF